MNKSKGQYEMQKRSLFLTQIVFFLCLLKTLAIGSDGVQCSAPVNEDQLTSCVESLRAKYSPYLRSLPEPLTIRKKFPIEGKWHFAFEIEDANKSASLPKSPEWYLSDFDDSAWQKVTVPEWRYNHAGHTEKNWNCNLDKSPWTFLRASSNVCWYRINFSIQKPPVNKRLWLCFDGVDWEAQVFLNDKFIGDHRVYYEPFRFDITDTIQSANTLAVRVIDGPVFGEPISFWSIFPEIRARQQRYVREPSLSIDGNRFIGLHLGGGFGIFRDVYLEETGSAVISALFVRNDLSSGTANVKIELDSLIKKATDLQVEIIPENFEGVTYEKTVHYDLEKESAVKELVIPMSGAKTWSPNSPFLYRCRVSVKVNEQTIDSKDAIFGCRSFAIVTKNKSREGLTEGTFLLNDQPVYLRGTNVQGLNLFWYWKQEDVLLNTLLMLKAANFNSIRSTQHVQFREVREYLDRLGIMSEQDQGGMYQNKQLIHCGSVLAKECFNNPGVVLLSFANEVYFDPSATLTAALIVDPQRIFKPISGKQPWANKYTFNQNLWDHVVDDYHTYGGWYDGGTQPTWLSVPILGGGLRMVTVGEYGGEALDAYKTMAWNYPDHLQPPPLTTDTLWAASQVGKKDRRQKTGFYGEFPKNLGEYIEASQNYQAELVADHTIAYRLAPKQIGGYFQFHFIDPVPAFWPKSIVSHDLKPKKAYFQMAQVNQTTVPLFKLKGEKPEEMEIWVANDLPDEFKACEVKWKIASKDISLIDGQRKVDVPASDAIMVEKFSLQNFLEGIDKMHVSLELINNAAEVISRYERTVSLVWARVGP